MIQEYQVKENAIHQHKFQNPDLFDLNESSDNNNSKKQRISAVNRISDYLESKNVLNRSIDMNNYSNRLANISTDSISYSVNNQYSSTNYNSNTLKDIFPKEFFREMPVTSKRRTIRLNQNIYGKSNMSLKQQHQSLAQEYCDQQINYEDESNKSNKTNGQILFTFGDQSQDMNDTNGNDDTHLTFQYNNNIIKEAEGNGDIVQKDKYSKREKMQTDQVLNLLTSNDIFLNENNNAVDNIQTKINNKCLNRKSIKVEQEDNFNFINSYNPKQNIFQQRYFKQRNSVSATSQHHPLPIRYLLTPRQSSTSTHSPIRFLPFKDFKQQNKDQQGRENNSSKEQSSTEQHEQITSQLPPPQQQQQQEKQQEQQQVLPTFSIHNQVNIQIRDNSNKRQRRSVDENIMIDSRVKNLNHLNKHNFSSHSHNNNNSSKIYGKQKPLLSNQYLNYCQDKSIVESPLVIKDSSRILKESNRLKYLSSAENNNKFNSHEPLKIQKFSLLLQNLPKISSIRQQLDDSKRGIIFQSLNNEQTSILHNPKKKNKYYQKEMNL